MPLLSIERGGAEQHYGLQPRSGIASEFAADNPLDRVMAAWSKQDIAPIMESEAYRRSSHPDHAQAQALVRAWFERKYRAGPAQRDATRRTRQETAERASSAARTVHVRAHTREGGKEHVRAHARSWPE